MKPRVILSSVCLVALLQANLYGQQPILVKDINSGAGNATPKNLTFYNGKLYFQAFDNLNGAELWATDGTDSGTEMVKDINPGSGSSNPQELKVYNGKLYFQADNGVDTVRTELWVSDGTAAGTYLLKKINTNTSITTLGSVPSGFTECNGKLYFTARDNGGAGTGDELWVTDGTEAGTQLVKDIWAGFNSGAPSFYTVYNNKLYFSAQSGTPNTELYVSDGTTAGTYMLKDINNGSSGSPKGFKVYNGELYFSADDGIHGRELWVTDGTEPGTVMFKDFYTGTQSGQPTALTLWNNKLYFIARDATNAIYSDLWATDGTLSGTQKVTTSPPVTNWAINDIYFPYNGKLLLDASNSATGDKLFHTDGTAAGTVGLVSVNNTDNFGDNIRLPTLHNGRVYFTADDRTGSGRQLWVTDGSQDSTYIVLPSGGVLNNAVPYVNELIEFNGYLFYTANYKGTTGLELYKVTLPVPQTPTRLNEGVRSITGISILPNPVIDELTVTTTDQLGKHYSLQILNSVGAVVYEGFFEEKVLKVDTRTFAPGLYIFRVQGNKGEQFVTKLIKQ